MRPLWIHAPRGVGERPAAFEAGAREQEGCGHEFGPCAGEKERHVGSDPLAREARRADLGQGCVPIARQKFGRVGTARDPAGPSPWPQNSTVKAAPGQSTGGAARRAALP
jgi:hypothetical protein